MTRWPLIIALCLLASVAGATSYTFGKYLKLNRQSHESQDSTIEANCVLWQPIEHNDGTNEYDASTSQNDGIYPSVGETAAFSNPAPGLAWRQFDGVDDEIQVANAAELNINATGDLSWTLWINWAGTNTGINTFISKRNGDDRWFGYMNNNKLTFDVKDGAVGAFVQIQDFSGKINFGEWHHLAGTFDHDSATGMKIYLDGVAYATTNPTAIGNCSNTSPLIIGNESFVSRHTQAAIDDPRIYSAALSAAQVATSWWHTVKAHWPNWNLLDPNYANLKLWHDLTSEPSTTNFWVKDTSYANTDNTLTGGNVGSQIIADSQPTWSNANGGFLQFDGVDDHVEVGSVDTYMPYTMAAWVKLATTNARTVMGYSDAAFIDIQNIDIFIGEVRANIESSGDRRYWKTSALLTSNTWYHIAIVQTNSANAPIAYVDGVANAMSVFSSVGGAPGTQTLPLSVGRPGDYDGVYFNGSIDDPRIYSAALSAIDIGIMYTNTVGAHP